MRLSTVLLSASLLFCGMPLVAGGQAPASQPANEPPRIAVIQFQNAVTASNEFQRDFADLQKKFEPKRTELKNLNDEIDRLSQQLQTDGDKLGEEERNTRARAIDNKRRQEQRMAEDDQNDYNQALQDLFNRVGGKVGELLTGYAKDHGFTLVIDRTEQGQQIPVVLYASPSTDITRQIVEAYNAKSGVPPQAAAPAAPQP